MNSIRRQKKRTGTDKKQARYKRNKGGGGGGGRAGWPLGWLALCVADSQVRYKTLALKTNSTPTPHHVAIIAASQHKTDDPI